MNPKASLQELVDYFKDPPKTCRFYFDRQTGKLVDVDEPIMKAVSESDQATLASLDDWDNDQAEMAKEILNDKSKRFVQLPDNVERDEERLKAEFIGTLHDERIAAKLKRSTKKDLFSIFRITSFAAVLYRFRLEQDWYKYQVEATRRSAIKWADANSVPYQDDLTGAKTKA